MARSTAALVRAPATWTICAVLAAITAVGIIAVRRSTFRPSNSPAFDPAQLQCAHWSIFRACQLLGVNVELPHLLRALPPSPQGHNLHEVSRAVNDLGVRTEALTLSWDLLAARRLPCIAHLKTPDHFVTVSAIDSYTGHVHVYDGAGTRFRFERSQFERRWSGVTLVLEKVGASTAPSRGLDFDRLLVDHGDIPATGEAAVFAFPFRNLGRTDLVIQQVRTSCTCLRSEKPDHPIQPGESSVIKLFYNVSPRQGPFVQTALVQTSDPDHPLITLVAAGHSGTSVTVSPSAVAVNDLIAGRQRTIRFVVAHDVGIPAFEIVKATAELVNAEVVGIRPLNGDRPATDDPSSSRVRPASPSPRRLIDLVIRPTGKLGDDVTGRVTIQTNVTGYESFSIPLTGRIVPAVRAMPEYLVFDREGPSPVKVSLRLMARDPSHRYRLLGIASATETLSDDLYVASEITGGLCVEFALPLATAMRLSREAAVVRLQDTLTDELVTCNVNFFVR